MKLALLSVFLALPILAQSSQPVKFVTADPSGACSNGTAMRYNWMNGKFWGCLATVWTQVSGSSGGSGTVTVAGSGNLGSTQCVTGAGTQVVQTPSASCTVDSSGNLVVNTITTSGTGPGVIKTGPTTVSALPTCNSPANGSRAAVTDATATTFLSVVAGGGGNNVPVYCDGSVWRVG